MVKEIVTSDDGAMATVFMELRERDYPFRLEYVSQRTGQVVWSADVTEPGAIRVPALMPVYGPVETIMRFPDGEVWSSDVPYPHPLA